MKTTPRHLFVSQDAIEYAYNDHPAPHWIWSNNFPALYCCFNDRILNLKGDERVLEIGNGFRVPGCSSFSVNRFLLFHRVVKELAEISASRLKDLDIICGVKWGDGYKGWQKCSFRWNNYHRA